MIRGKRKEDPEKIKARAERDRARMWLEILKKGIADQIVEAYNPDELRMAIDRVNGELVEALIAREKAETAYEPYWERPPKNKDL